MADASQASGRRGYVTPETGERKTLIEFYDLRSGPGRPNLTQTPLLPTRIAVLALTPGCVRVLELNCFSNFPNSRTQAALMTEGTCADEFRR